MKKYQTKMLLAAMLLLSFGASGQTSKKVEVPDNVKTACLKKFPQSASAKLTWEMEKGNYEANWGGKTGEDNSAVFTPTGDFLEIVKTIPVSQLPAPALAYVKSHEHGAKISEAGLVTDAKGIVTYEAEIKGKELIFDQSGKILKTE